MANFLSKLFSFGSDIAYAYSSVQTQTMKAKKVLDKILDTNKDVPIEEFLKMYDMRMYDISNKQSDIKFMKNVDFEGVYILRNATQNKCFVGKASKVFKKIERHFTGYGNEEIYSEWRKGNKFYINIIRLENSGYDNINYLERDIKEKYNAFDY